MWLTSRRVTSGGGLFQLPTSNSQTVSRLGVGNSGVHAFLFTDAGTPASSIPTYNPPPVSSHMSLAPGARLGPYEVLRLIGAGGWARCIGSRHVSRADTPRPS